MPSLASAQIRGISDAIRDGSFVDSDDVLSADLSPATVPSLLDSLALNREALQQEIQQSSQALGPDVDEWIAKAKNLQDDIAKCKDEARSVVQDHHRIDSLRSQTVEIGRKIDLLEAEIEFTVRLEEQLRSISHITAALQHIESLLTTHQQQQQQEGAPTAAHAIKEVNSSISHLRGCQVRSIIEVWAAKLQSQAKAQLHDAVFRVFLIERDSGSCTLEISESATKESLASLLQGLQHIDAATEVVDRLGHKLEPVLLHPLRKQPKPSLKGYSSTGHRFEVSLLQDAKASPVAVNVVIHFMIAFWDFLDSYLPQPIVESLSAHLMSKAIDILVQNWLPPAIPLHIHELGALDELKSHISDLEGYLKTHGWPGATKLSKWIDDAPGFWLARRKAETLDAVRKAFSASKGYLHQVERVETQSAPPAQIDGKDDKINVTQKATDDWDASWDEAEPHSGDTGEGDDDTSGWGFDDVEQATPVEAAQNGTDHAPAKSGETGEDDAWGWGDDEEEADKAAKAKEEHNAVVPEEIKLTEYYSITDIPDHLIEIVGRDIQDSISLAQEEHPSLQRVSASKGLAALPVLALAMFRATAPTHYANSPSLGNMNLYNDASYLAEKLRAIILPDNMQSMEPDCKAMDRFARSAYSREMELQKTILNDLLDGAQGFTACTQPLYAREIENAVSSTVDRVKQVYDEWKPILSTSALLQSVGALVTLVIHKFISDIEEMDEISAPQSEKLVSFASHLANLGDLFVATPPPAAPDADTTTGSSSEKQSVQMAAVYVPNWLKFQYLINILDSSLVDINFLWTEGELSLEFSADEVIDLIKALFQDSSHRKKAIATIRSRPSTGL